MGANGYLTTEDLIYSCVYGSGIYRKSGQVVQDPIGGDNSEEYLSPLLKNIITGEEFFMKRLHCSFAVCNRYRERILNPPCRQHILWPSDLIVLDETQANECSLFVAQEYSEEVTPVDQRQGFHALLFPYAGYPKMINGIRRMAKVPQKSWKNAEIRTLAYKILVAIESINRCGYVYEDIHLSRIFFDENDDVYLNFTNLAYTFSDLTANDAKEICSVQEGGYPIEFADPSVVRGTKKILDFQSQNFSICSLLFYLFFDQYPYDGRLLTGYVDDSIQHHYIKFRDYHKMPVFIFDPDDSQNALGAFDEEQQVIDLWEECPLEIREFFIATLKRENAERIKSTDNPTPSMWIKCLTTVGWIKGDGMEGL